MNDQSKTPRHQCTRAAIAEAEVAKLRSLLSRLHEAALYENECPWCHEDPDDEHAFSTDEDGDSHPCFGEELHAAIKDAPRSTSARPPDGT